MMRQHAATALLLHAVYAYLCGCAAQPPWLPWRIEHRNAVSGRSNLDSPHVWRAGRTPTMAACQSLCANNKTCNSFDWAGTSSEEYPCSAALSCYFRSDRVFKPKSDTKCNHTCGTRIKPDPLPPRPLPPVLPPLPPPPATHPPLGHQPNIVFILTDDQDRTLGNEDYTYLGSLEIMPTVRRELIAKGAFLQNFFVNTPICCPSRTEFFSGRYYHNIGPPNEEGSCMHCDTENAVYPLTSLFGLLTRAGYNTGVFGKVTNDQSKVLPLATTWSSMEYIDSPLKYNNYMGTSYFRKWPNGTQLIEEIDPENPASCAGVADCLPYQTSQIGNRTQRWLEQALSGPKPVFAYLGPHAPHYPAQPAPWYNTSFLDPLVTIPITPNWNLSSPSKAQHVRQNPAFTEAVHCWENQHFRDRWRTLLSVDDLVDMVVDTFTKAGKIDDTYIFYSSDHGYKQGQWRIGTSKQHPYDTDIRVPLLARGPGIKPGAVFNEPSGNVDLTPTILTIAGGLDYVPPFMDGRSMTAFLTPSLEANDVLVAKPWRRHFLNEYKSVGTYYNDHSHCWGNDVINGRTCPGSMPRSPVPVPDQSVLGPAVIEGADETMFVPADAVSADAGCVESTGIGDGNCYFVDSTHSNNWRQLRIVGGDDGVDMNYIEYDPEFAFNDTANMQHYELYNVSQDKYQMHNIYSSQTTGKKAELHQLLDEYFRCGAPVRGSIQNGLMPDGHSNCP